MNCSNRRPAEAPGFATLRRSFGGTSIALLGVILYLLSSPAYAQVNFEKQIAPLFEKHCISCHGPEKQKGGLRLDRKQEALQGGDNGVVLVPRNSAQSRLLLAVSGK